MQVLWRNRRPLGMGSLPRLCDQVPKDKHSCRPSKFPPVVGTGTQHPLSGLLNPGSTSYPLADCLFMSLCKGVATKTYKHGAALPSHQLLPPQEQKFTPLPSPCSTPLPHAALLSAIYYSFPPSSTSLSPCSTLPHLPLFSLIFHPTPSCSTPS